MLETCRRTETEQDMILIVSVTGGTYMNITTRITKLDNPESKLKALATVVLNGNFAVGGIKVI